jgi:hypothetical protein
LVAVPRCLPEASDGRSKASQAGDSEVAVEFAEVVAGGEQFPLAAGVVQAAKQDVLPCRVAIWPKTGSTMALRRV